MNLLKSPNSKNRKNFADARKDPTSCLLTPGRWWQGGAICSPIPSSLQAMPPPKSLSNQELIALYPGPPGMLAA